MNILCDIHTLYVEVRIYFEKCESMTGILFFSKVKLPGNINLFFWRQGQYFPPLEI